MTIDGAKCRTSDGADGLEGDDRANASNTDHEKPSDSNADHEEGPATDLRRSLDD